MDAQVIPHGVDFVTKKQGNTCSGVSNQSLFWRQLQVEFFSKEGRQLRFDLFSLTFGTSEAQQEVIRITAISQTSIVRIVRVKAGHVSHLLKHGLRFIPLPTGSTTFPTMQ